MIRRLPGATRPDPLFPDTALCRSVGLGGRYSMSDWGSWVLGVSRAQQSLGNGWRYQLGYQVDVSTDVQLSWVNEQRGDGYSDLSGYGGVPAAGSSVRNQ